MIGGIFINKRRLGEAYEEKAAKYLEDNGCRIIERNFRCKIGEVDIIARDSKYFVFVEVKYRTSSRIADPVYAVNYRKQRTISKVAQFFLITHRLPESTPVRFDVITFTGENLRHIKNAFSYKA